MSRRLLAIFAFGLNVFMACRKDPLSYTNKLTGTHTWFGTVNLRSATIYPDTFVGSIFVLDERTILFEAAIYDTMRLLSSEKKSRRLTFTSGKMLSYKEWSYDTIVYDYANDIIFYNSEEKSASYITTTQYRTR